jgi:hypothetical protein
MGISESIIGYGRSDPTPRNKQRQQNPAAKEHRLEAPAVDIKTGPDYIVYGNGVFVIPPVQNIYEIAQCLADFRGQHPELRISRIMRQRHDCLASGLILIAEPKPNKQKHIVTAERQLVEAKRTIRLPYSWVMRKKPLWLLEEQN